MTKNRVCLGVAEELEFGKCRLEQAVGEPVERFGVGCIFRGKECKEGKSSQR